MCSVEVVAHRGAGGDSLENTLTAFERAIERGADAVEFDVRLIVDCVPFV
jgi:glycerophosphoryl diester phosphodiesterase